jgi:hypothetical protein
VLDACLLRCPYAICTYAFLLLARFHASKKMYLALSLLCLVPISQNIFLSLSLFPFPLVSTSIYLLIVMHTDQLVFFDRRQGRRRRRKMKNRMESSMSQMSKDIHSIILSLSSISAFLFPSMTCSLVSARTNSSRLFVINVNS